MSRIRVVAYKHLPAGLPIVRGVVLWLALDHTNASPAVRGVLWTLYGLSFLAHVVALCVQTQADPFTVKP